jgi:hypothetical protein
MEKIRTTLRLDESFHNEILQLAEREDRSLNSQIILLLKIGKEHYKPNYKPKYRKRDKNEY